MVRLKTHVDYPYFPFRLAVDYVLVWRSSNKEGQVYRQLFENVHVCFLKLEQLSHRAALRREGLILSEEKTGPLHFALISTPFHRLCKEAEKNNISFPLTNCPIAPAVPTCCISLSKIFITNDNVGYVCAPFNRKYCEHFLTYTDEVHFFSSAQRSLLTEQIMKEVDISKQINGLVGRDPADTTKKGLAAQSLSLSETTIFGEEPLRRKGLLYLLMQGAYDDAFILHEPSEEEPYFREIKERKPVDYMQLLSDISRDPRKELADTWCRWFKFQPLNQIRNYFGEQNAFYFAWQGNFITVLWVATFIGLLVFLYGLIRSIRLFPYEKCIVSNSTGYLTELDAVQCHFRDGARHLYSTLTNWFMKAFDNELNPFFAVFMSIWGAVFSQIWKRNNSVLAYEWNCEDYTETEPDRPEFVGTRIEIDPVTGQPDWFYPQVRRFFKIVFSVLVVLGCMASVVISVMLVTLYKLYAVHANDCGKEYTLACSITSAWLPSVMNTISTMILGQMYTRIAEWLNRWENHRTQSEHHNALIIKIFAFSFVNNYTSLFYIAVVRPENHGFQPNGLFGLGLAYRDTCAEGSCGSLLALQLITHMLIKPFPKFFKDICLPYFVQLYRTLSWYNRHESFQDVLMEKDETNVLVREWLKPTAEDFALWEFNEKILLFGTTMMFAALFPLAPLIALIIGIVDIRLDASRLIWFNRRPVPVVTTGIGIWLPIQKFLQYAAVTTNAFIVAFTSDFCVNFFAEGNVMECTFQNRLLIVIVFQNMVFLLNYVIQSVIPTVPGSIRVAIRRKRFVVGYLVEKGDVPKEIKKRKDARRAKMTWISKIIQKRPQQEEITRNVDQDGAPTSPPVIVSSSHSRKRRKKWSKEVHISAAPSRSVFPKVS